METLPPIPRTTVISWMDAVVKERKLIELSGMLLFYVVVWYLVATLPLWLSGQSNLLLHFIWPLGGGGMFLSFLLYSVFRPVIDAHINNIDVIISEESKISFRNNVSSILNQLAAHKSTVVLSCAAITFFYLLISITWMGNIGFTVFDFMGQDWFARTNGLFLRTISLTMSIVPIMFILVTGFRLIFSVLKLVTVVKHVELIPSPRICLRKIMPTLKILLWISFLFSAFAGLFIILFQANLWPINKFSIWYWCVILGIICTGMAGVMYPMFVVRKKIHKIKEARLDKITEQVLLLTKKGDINSIKVILELYRLEEQLELNDKVESLFMGWKYLSSFILSIVFPLLLAIAQIYMQDFLMSN